MTDRLKLSDLEWWKKTSRLSKVGHRVHEPTILIRILTLMLAGRIAADKGKATEAKKSCEVTEYTNQR